MWIDMLVELFTSKKFVVAVSGIAATLAAKVGWDLDPELVVTLIGVIVGAYVVAQGQADKGKSAAIINAAAKGPDGTDG